MSTGTSLEGISRVEEPPPTVLMVDDVAQATLAVSNGKLPEEKPEVHVLLRAPSPLCLGKYTLIGLSEI